MSEWFKETVLKIVVLKIPWVRIPLYLNFRLNSIIGNVLGCKP
jgi:hypothetical protein